MIVVSSVECVGLEGRRTPLHLSAVVAFWKGRFGYASSVA
jgi:hypothetical protein